MKKLASILLSLFAVAAISMCTIGAYAKTPVSSPNSGNGGGDHGSGDVTDSTDRGEGTTTRPGQRPGDPDDPWYYNPNNPNSPYYKGNKGQGTGTSTSSPKTNDNFYVYIAAGAGIVVLAGTAGVIAYKKLRKEQ